jgi:hypothetical protein
MKCLWKVTWRDYKGHKLGGPHPPILTVKCHSRAEAENVVAGLGNMPGAEIVASITEIPRRPIREQADFGFPIGGPMRLTP